MISYDGLFALLKTKGLSKTALAKKAGISSRTLAKLGNGDYVAMKVIEDICRALDCNIGDILSVSADAQPVGRLLSVLREEKAMKLKGGLYHQTQIEMTYNSNHIEGGKLTKDQTRYIFETNTIGLEADKTVNVDDIAETSNHFRCIDYALDKASEPLTEDIIKEFHRLLKSNTSDSSKDWFAVGDYKKKPNAVGDMPTTPPKKVAAALQKLLADYGKLPHPAIEDIIAFHREFEAIHPFQDGNGRVGRLVAFKECLRFDITPFIIDENLRLFYYRGFKEWPNERGYLSDTCKAGQDKYRAIIDYFMSDEN
ncbi:MAG: Fic family protein [Clostridiales bacterium]|jgi:DNA-binding Xre family transcriptional regulator/fido (protein-threonine AMPylation protein)|nr:Fic family protein [Clostridiales bacterium]